MRKAYGKIADEGDHWRRIRDRKCMQKMRVMLMTGWDGQRGTMLERLQ